MYELESGGEIKSYISVSKMQNALIAIPSPRRGSKPFCRLATASVATYPSLSFESLETQSVVKEREAREDRSFLGRGREIRARYDAVKPSGFHGG